MKPFNLKDVKFTGGFWAGYRHLIRDVVIPYQWDALNDNIQDAEPSNAIRNFKVAAGMQEGGFSGFVFQDSDLYKWLEAVGYSLATDPDPSLEEKADQTIAYIEKAQQPDGYLNTYFIINGLERRFTNLIDCHELYCLGHLIEAAVAYWEGTGKRRLLDVACRFADLVDSLFGPEALKGYPGHQELELALVKLYGATGEERYLKLAAFFIDQRGASPHFFIEEWIKRGRTRHWTTDTRHEPDLRYNQAHLPVRLQDKAVGHAVRAAYMYTGMADLAGLTNDPSLLAACKTLWDNVTTKQMYITGGIGQTENGEAFSFDYDLPNDTVYSETCAAIGLVFFARRMLALEKDSRYADVMERALYNGIISGIETDGQKFLYVNPLEVWPEASAKNPGKRHITPTRQKWFGCACCPPNLARLITSLGAYMYDFDRDGGKTTVYTHLYGCCEVCFTVDGTNITLTQDTNYPWNGSVVMKVSGSGAPFTIALRIPGWCREPQIKVDGKPIDCTQQIRGYVLLDGPWQDNQIEIDFPMPVEVMRANINVRANAGKAALQKGPMVYCLEETDNGANLSALRLLAGEGFQERTDEATGVVFIEAKGERDISDHTSLYFPVAKGKEKADLTFIPYYFWGNRGEGEMMVWVRSE